MGEDEGFRRVTRKLGSRLGCMDMMPAEWLWLITADENDEEGSRVLVRAKCNIGGVSWRDGGYRITARDAAYDGENGRHGRTTVVDRVTPMTGNAHAIFAAAVTRPDPAAPVKAGKQHAARDAILNLLKPGTPVLKTQVIGVLSERGACAAHA